MPSSRSSSRLPAEPSHKPSPQRSRFKTISAKLFHSSSAHAHQSPSPPRQHVIPSEPMPYHPPRSDVPLPSDSPPRVFIRDGLPDDPLHSTPSGISGLPVKEHRPWNEMSILASAIQLPDSAQPTISTFIPNQPLPKQVAESKLPRSVSNSSSISNAYRRGRSGSRSSVTKPENVTGQRRMSRCLSFDNILPLFTASSPRKERVNHSEEPLLNDPRWSTIRSTEISDRTTSLADTDIPKANRMALPPIRTMRSKFVLGGPKDKSGLLAIVKADLAARQALKEKEGMKKKEEEFQAVSLGSAAGRGLSGAIKSLGEEKKENGIRWWELGQIGELSPVSSDDLS